MIKGLLKGFLQRDGIHIMYATIVARILSFFALWIALKLIPSHELGFVIYAQNIIAVLIPLSGFGAIQGLLRFGALAKTKDIQVKLFWYTLLKGLIFSVILILILGVFSGFMTKNLSDAQPFLLILSLQLITMFALENLKTYFRVVHKNKKYAQIEISYNILLVVLVFIGSYYFKEIGYTTALIITPVLVLLFFFPGLKYQFIKKIPIKTNLKQFWRYSFFAGLSGVTGQLLIILDIILIGNILSDPEKVTLYRYLSLIPFSLLFLPRVLLTTDFVTLTQKYHDEVFINKYIKSYIILFTGFSVIVIGLGWIFSSQILQLFGDEFTKYKDVFITLLIGTSGILILRGLFGNLLSTIGKAHINFWISIIGISINLISNYFLIPHFGIFGAAITSMIIMWTTSIITTLLFKYYFKQIHLP